MYEEKQFVWDHLLFNMGIRCLRPLVWVLHGSEGERVWHSLAISL